MRRSSCYDCKSHDYPYIDWRSNCKKCIYMSDLEDMFEKKELNNEL